MKRKMKVLLVDDEEEFVKALAERLEMRDLSSDTVYDGEGALSYVENQEPDVMVLDLKMPGIDGMDVLKKVKMAYPDIEVIMLTGHGTKKDEEEARRLGIFDYMEKPVDIDSLVKRMKDAFRRKLDRYTAAATFAEAGEADEAKKIYDEK
ncbi:MAG: response regulator [Thermodesulfobacteriota bacterium]